MATQEARARPVPDLRCVGDAGELVLFNARHLRPRTAAAGERVQAPIQLKNLPLDAVTPTTLQISTVYNKLFSKIVTSSIWLEPTPTRIVWLMFIALMNEDGFVQFASVANVAHTARITEPEAGEAIKILAAPDSNSADQDHEGRRIERVPGGWIILNAAKYRDLVTREMVREQTRERVARWRANKKKSNGVVTSCNGEVTQSDTDTKRKKKASGRPMPPFNLEDWLSELENDETYQGLNIRTEYGKCRNWCVVRKLALSKRRFVNWLNRADRKLLPSDVAKTSYGKNYLPPRREPTDEELAAQRKIVREASEKLRQELHK